MRVQTKVITINFDPKELKEIDKVVKKANYATRSAFIKQAIRNYLVEIKNIES